MAAWTHQLMPASMILPASLHFEVVLLIYTVDKNAYFHSLPRWCHLDTVTRNLWSMISNFTHATCHQNHFVYEKKVKVKHVSKYSDSKSHISVSVCFHNAAKVSNSNSGFNFNMLYWASFLFLHYIYVIFTLLMKI